MTTSSKGGTIYDPDAVNAANNNPDFNGCGFNNWAPDVTQDLFSSPRCKLDHTTDYNRFKIDGKTLYLCGGGGGGGNHDNTYDGSTEAKRIPNCDTNSIKALEGLVRQQ
jgi:hypothetical protein